MKSITRSAALALATAGLTATAAIAEPVTIEVASWKGNEAEPAGLPELIERFEAEHPDIKVKLNYISRSDVDVVLPPRLQGDSPPDVMMADMPLVKVWGDAGLLAELDRGDWFGRTSGDLQAAISNNGAVHIFPLEVIGMGNFVNVGLLKKAGLDRPPKTIDELVDACGRLSAAGINPMIFTGSFSAPLFVVANGLENSDAPAMKYGSGDQTFEDSAAFNRSLDLVRRLVDAKCFDPKVQAGLDPWSTALQEFKAGNFAMMPQGAWNIADFSNVDGLDFVFAPIPSEKGPGVALDLFGIGWVMSSKTRHPDEALAWIEFFNRDENLKIMLEAESAYSPFAGGSNGTPDVANPYNTARTEGGIIMYPIALLDWPKPLEAEIWDSLTGFLLNPSKDNADVLSRWDEIIEDQY